MPRRLLTAIPRIDVPRQNIVTIMVMVVLAAGLNPLLFQGFYHDDYGIVHTAIQHRSWEIFDPRNPEMAYHYDPVRQITFVAVAQVAGTNPWAFHLLSLSMQFACVVAWYKLSARFCSSWPIRLAFAAVLCTMPFVSEATISVAANDQLIGSMAYLWSLWAFLACHESGRGRYLWLSVLLYAAGLLVTEMLLTLPCLLILIIIFPGLWGLSSTRLRFRSLLPFIVLSCIYLVIHFAAADMTIFTQGGYTLRPGLHNLMNIDFCLKAVLLSPTLLLGAGAPLFWERFYGYLQSPWASLSCVVAMLAFLAWRRSRILAVWLLFSILPYAFRTSYPQGARYFHLPVAILLMTAAALAGAFIDRRKWCLVPVGAVTLLWLWIAIGVWVKVDNPYYQGLCDEGETAVQRVVAAIPHQDLSEEYIVVFNDLPFAVRYVVCKAVGLELMRWPSRPFNIVYYPDIDHYWAESPDPVPPDAEVDIPMDLTFIIKDPYADIHELDAAVPRISCVDRSGTEIAWNVKWPFPGHLVWRFTNDNGSDDSQSPGARLFAEAFLEEYPPDRRSEVPLRVFSWRLETPAGRIRLPRPSSPLTWARFRIVGANARSCQFDLLCLDAV